MIPNSQSDKPQFGEFYHWSTWLTRNRIWTLDLDSRSLGTKIFSPNKGPCSCTQCDLLAFHRRGTSGEPALSCTTALGQLSTACLHCWGWVGNNSPMAVPQGSPGSMLQQLRDNLQDQHALRPLKEPALRTKHLIANPGHAIVPFQASGSLTRKQGE